MYVCICNGHRERDIREAAARGLTCPRAIYAELGKPPRCGRCLELAANIIADVHESAANSPLPPVANEPLHERPARKRA